MWYSPGSRILFQGDSITHGGRGGDLNHVLGHGYAFIIGALHGARHPLLGLEFMNRGESGHTVIDLKNRWQRDAVDLKPDLLSVLVGINDVYFSRPGEDYEQTYDQILTQSRAVNPALRLVLCEPFTLPTGPYKEKFGPWRQRVREKQEAAARLAAKHGAVFVPLQKAFEDACRLAPAEHWIWDGVHPTCAGPQILADAWLATVEKAW